MDGNSRITRFNSGAKYVELRQPNTLGSTNLSPTAAEFIPKKNKNIPIYNIGNDNKTDTVTQDMNSMSLSKSVQSRLQVSTTKSSFTKQNTLIINQFEQVKNSPNVNTNYGAESISHSLNDIPTYPNMTENSFPTSQTVEEINEESYAINFIETVVNSLNENPGSFDLIAKEVQMLFEGFAENDFVLSNVMETIFNKSIEEQNFRYMGAKLYNLLDSIDHRKESMFRKLLSLKLRYHKEEILDFIKMKEQHKVRGTTLFLAELYMQLRDNGDTVHDIAPTIVFCIGQLLSNHSPENIKCICLTLKLAGFDLENDCRDEMNNIISNLKNIKNTDVSTSRLLESVLNLKDNRWGRTTEYKELTLPTNRTSFVSNGDYPVFYGPDGKVLTEEESLFLTSMSNCDNNDENDSEYECNDEMDAETESEFKDFLRKNRKK